MYRRAVVVVVEQVLAPGRGPSQYVTVDSGRRRCESALRAGNRHRCAGIATLMQPGQSMQGMPFGHAAYPLSAPGTGGAW